MVKNLPVMQETQVQSLSWEDRLEKGMQPAPVDSHGQRSWAGYSPCLEIPMDRGVGQATVLAVSESDTE